MIIKIKFILGVLLIICTCLPLGSCEHKDVIHSQTDKNILLNKNLKQIDKSNSNMNAPKLDYLIPIMQIKLHDPFSWFFFISFIWPLPLLLVKIRLCKTDIKNRIAVVIELLFSAFSAYLIYSFIFTLWYEPMIWGYFAFAVICLYLLTHLCEILRPIINLKDRKI